MYFEGDPLIQKCPIVSTLKSKTAVQRLTGVLDMAKTVPMDSLAYKFDIVIRGNQQTFFENKTEGS
jgi:protocatechuate 3,4-dioxygenase beta subunit